MFPNQPPPTSTAAAAGTSQTTTQTTAAQPTTTSTVTATLQLAVVANTANIPATTVASTSTGQQAGAVAGGIGPVRASARAPVRGRGAPYRAIAPAPANGTQPLPVLTHHRGESSYSLANTIAFFNQFPREVGMSWDGNYRGTQGTNRGDVTKGGIAASSLSFSQNAIDCCHSNELKELLLRANAERAPERRKYLLIKALRAFSETTEYLWSGALARFSFFLDMVWSSVTSWIISLPDTPTTVAAQNSVAPTSLPLSLNLPTDVLTWQELVSFLQPLLSLQLAPSFTAAAVRVDVAGPSSAGFVEQRAEETVYSTVGISFLESFIARQEPQLGVLMREFNNQNNLRNSNKLFAKILSILKDNILLPHGTYSRVCELVGESRVNISNWLVRYRSTISDARGAAGSAHAQAPAPQMAAPTPPAPIFAPQTVTTPAITLPAQIAIPVTTQAISVRFPQGVARRLIVQGPVTPLATTVTSVPARQAPVFFPATTTAAPPAHSVAQTAAPVFTAPATPSTSAAAQLAPVVPPFSPSASEASLEALLDLQPAPVSEPPALVAPVPAPSASEPFDVNMAMDEDEMFSLFDE